MFKTLWNKCGFTDDDDAPQAAKRLTVMTSLFKKVAPVDPAMTIQSQSSFPRPLYVAM